MAGAEALGLHGVGVGSIWAGPAPKLLRTWSIVLVARTTAVVAPSSASATARTWPSNGRPQMVCSTLGSDDRMRVPSPAARTTIPRRRLFIGISSAPASQDTSGVDKVARDLSISHDLQLPAGISKGSDFTEKKRAVRLNTPWTISNGPQPLRLRRSAFLVIGMRCAVPQHRSYWWLPGQGSNLDRRISKSVVLPLHNPAKTMPLARIIAWRGGWQLQRFLLPSLVASAAAPCL